jgi:ABC-type oligopeptide transport system substrate-binding subunit/class 3 adenylate cyclase/tetratricopeptide (TPR) repeat protein
MTVAAEQITRIKEAIAALETQRENLGNGVVDSAQASLKRELAELEGQQDELRQQRKFATILFMDVVDSTNLAYHLEADEMLEIMDSALRRLAKPVEDRGGHIARYQGDGFKAVFGVPTARENDPEQAVRAGLDILATAKEISHDLQQQWGISSFNVRVGINTGIIASGGKTEAQDTIMGEAVNLAARLEKAAPADGLLIAHDTYRHVRGIFRVNPLSPVVVKGFPEPIMIYQVIEKMPREFRVPTRGVEGVETRMVGREAELQLLKDTLQFAFDDKEGKIITILGEAGIGKSRLLYEFQNWLNILPQEQDVFFFKGRARPEIQNLPYGLLREIFAFRFQIREGDSVTSVWEKISAGIGDALGEGEIWEEKVRLVGKLLGIQFHEDQDIEKAYEDAQQMRDRGFEFIKEYFSQLSTRLPIVIFLEDLHWADDSSLDFLNELTEITSYFPILILCLTRPEFFERRPYWGEGHQQHLQMQLQPLNRKESRQLVNEILKYMPQVPEALIDLVVSTGEGNPFYIEEMIKMLIDQGAISKLVDEGSLKEGEVAFERWETILERLGDVEIPVTLIGVLQARIDSLTTVEKTVLQQAAVVGRVFWDGAVVSASSCLKLKLQVEEVEKALSSLRSKNLIFRREKSNLAQFQEYIFQHSLLRDVTYDSLTMRERRAVHGRVAEWLIEQSGIRIDEYTGLIAEHLILAGQNEKAAEYLITAGDHARSVYAHPEAERYYLQAIELLRKLGESETASRTLFKLGLAYTAAFETEKARQVYDEAFRLAEPGFDFMQADDKVGETVTIAAEQPVTLDPGETHDDVSTFFTSQLFHGLVRIEEGFNVLPATAARWDVSMDGCSYRFYLRDDVHWSDGTLVSAENFEFALKRNLDPQLDFSYASLLSPIKNARAYLKGELTQVDEVGVRAVDARTLELHLESPSAYLPYLLTQNIAFPLPRWLLEGPGEFDWTQAGKFISNGPYHLVEWQPDEGFVLARNPFYLGPFEGNVGRVVCKFYSSYDQALDAYDSGEVDMVTLLNADPEAIGRVIETHGEEIIRIAHPSTFFLNFRVDRPPFNDHRLRKALIMAVNRQGLVQEAFSGQRIPATGGFIPPGMPGYSTNIGLSYNPERARQLLDEAGYAHGKGFPTVTWLHSPGGSHVYRYLQNSWKDNLNLDLVPQCIEDWDDYLEKLYHDPAELMLTGWSADYPDPDFMLRITFHSDEGINFPLWQDTQFDAIISEASVISDHQRRMMLYQQADKILVREQAVIMPLTYGERYMLVKPRVNLPRKASLPISFRKFRVENSQE